jgi:hypothetical protein
MGSGGGKNVFFGQKPSEPDRGKMSLCEIDLGGVLVQGRMLTGFCINGYLNAVVRHVFHNGVRAVHDSFFDVLVRSWENSGRDGWFAWMEKWYNWPGVGMDLVNLKEDPLLLMPIFRGPQDYGHWALLIIDRLFGKSGLATFFDSLPSYFQDTPQLLEEKL